MIYRHVVKSILRRKPKPLHAATGGGGYVRKVSVSHQQHYILNPQKYTDPLSFYHYEAATITSQSTSIMMAAINKLAKRHAMMFGATVTMLKTASADVFTQVYIEGKGFEDIDRNRVISFAVFGFAYMGVAQYGLYVKLLSQRFFPNAGVYAAKSFRNKLKDLKGTKELLGQVCIDNFVFIPFLFYPTYYFTKEVIMPNTTSGIYNSPAEEGGGMAGLLNKVWNKYTSNFYDDVTATWKIWLVADAVNFGLMPIHMRVPFMAIISFGFTIFLSLRRGGREPGVVTTTASTTTTTTKDMIMKPSLSSIHQPLNYSSNSSSNGGNINIHVQYHKDAAVYYFLEGEVSDL